MSLCSSNIGFLDVNHFEKDADLHEPLVFWSSMALLMILLVKTINSLWSWFWTRKMKWLKYSYRIRKTWIQISLPLWLDDLGAVTCTQHHLSQCEDKMEKEEDCIYWMKKQSGLIHQMSWIRAPGVNQTLMWTCYKSETGDGKALIGNSREDK